MGGAIDSTSKASQRERRRLVGRQLISLHPCTLIKQKCNDILLKSIAVTLLKSVKSTLLKSVVLCLCVIRHL